MTLPPSDVKEVVERASAVIERLERQSSGADPDSVQAVKDSRTIRSLLAYITHLEEKRDQWKERAGFLWTAPDVDAWGQAAEAKGLQLRDKINGLLRRAVRAEEAERAAESRLQALSAAVEGVREAIEPWVGHMRAIGEDDGHRVRLYTDQGYREVPWAHFEALAQALSELEKAGGAPT